MRHRPIRIVDDQQRMLCVAFETASVRLEELGKQTIRVQRELGGEGRAATTAAVSKAQQKVAKQWETVSKLERTLCEQRLVLGDMEMQDKLLLVF